MIQRKQTIFLMLSVIVGLICLCLPLATLQPKGMGADVVMTNLWIVQADGTKQFNVSALFALLLLTNSLQVFTIFDFRNRKRQIKLCTLAFLLLLGWCGVYAYFTFCAFEGYDLHRNITAILPVVSIVLVLMARQSIAADEELVRSADRIR